MVVDVEQVDRLEVFAGGAWETYPPDPAFFEPLAVVTDRAVLVEWTARLATVRVADGVVVPALPGLSLVFLDADGDPIARVDLVTAQWVRSGPCDGLLAEAVPARLLEQFGATGRFGPARAAVDQRGALEPATELGRRLTEGFERAWPDVRPPGDELRFSPHWVRLHSLPGSRRLPADETDYQELLRRHLTVLGELAGSPTVVVVTCSWSAGPTPHPRSAPVQRLSPAAQYWRSVIADDSLPDEPTWTHLFAEEFDLEADRTRLATLLRVVADALTADVLITDENVSWLYRPYDGGADVHLADPARRDDLRARHADWLSGDPSGL